MKPEAPSCDRVAELVEAYVDGDLAPPAQARIANHAAACPRCAAQVALAERIRAQLHGLPRLDAPPGVIAGIKAEAGADRRERAAGPRWRRPLWAALAAAVLLVAVAVSLLTPDPRTPSDAELARAADEARYALARVTQLTRKATRDAGRELTPLRLAAPAIDTLARSLGRARSATDTTRKDEGGAES
jgi:anti-sigma factor RsiW